MPARRGDRRVTVARRPPTPYATTGSSAYSLSRTQPSGCAALWQVAEEVTNAGNRLGQIVEAVRIRKPHIALAVHAKAGAGDRRDPGLVQKLGLEFLGVVAGAGDVRERVERAARVGAAKAGEGVERGDDHLPPLGKGRDHHPHRLARAFERGE